MVIDLNTTFCYKCPECFQFHKEELNIFSCKAKVSGCRCKKSGFAITSKKDKFEISIPCFACGEIHTFRLSVKQLFKSDLFLFNCPVSELDIGSVGKRDKIIAWETEYSVFLNSIIFDDTEK